MNSVLCTGSLELQRSKHSEVLLQYLLTGSSADVRSVKAKKSPVDPTSQLPCM